MAIEVGQGTMGKRKWLNGLVTSTIAIAALAGLVVIQRLQLSRPSLWLENPKQAEQQEALRLDLLKRSPTFGLDNVTADWIFLNFLQYFGDDPARDLTGYALSANYLDVVTQLDPRFVEVYPFVSNSISYQLGKPEFSVALMKRGTAVLNPKMTPLAFQVWRFMGLDQLLLLGDVRGAIYSHEQAATWVENTPYQDYAPLFRATANFLRRDPDNVAVRIGSWAAIYEQAAQIGDLRTQERAKREITTLGGKVYTKNGKLVVQMLPGKPVTKKAKMQ